MSSASRYTCVTRKTRVEHKEPSMYIVYYETENHYNSKVHAIVRMANFKVIRNLLIWYQRASMRKLASIAFWVLGF